ncbi:titin isoform X3 [Pogonomyrmex barbatus]|uniref:Titin isoform X3 n=1 Tax=Pogonomyrmex barbatus TaxID=144034 RepID=A0A8N1S3I1_9HYME|nr:titin isoform X3 [Pogonomyrmex barbatus]
MEPEQRGRASRASSTSSLGREVRCGCQYYQSDSLLPERRALLVRPSSRTMQQPPAVRCSEHDYEPIAPPMPHPAMAPVVRITDTDVMPVADSDDSIDDQGRLPPELILDGDVILPLDGKIEDTAMEGRELVATGDTSEEQEPTAQQFQDRLEERFLASTPYTESRTTDGEVNTSQVDSSAIEELPLRRGARGLPQRLKTQAGKLRSRLRGFQRPTFSFPQKRQKPEITTTTTTTTRSAAASSGKSDKSRKSVEKRPSRIDRIRMSISEKTGKFSLPDRSKFHLPERPKFSFPDKSRFHLPDKSKFTIKKPNIRLPGALARIKRSSSMREQQQQHSTESTAGSKRNIFDFATYPRIFDKKSKKRGEYATSSPKDSRAQSAESATFPRARKGKFTARWTQRFGDAAYVQDEDRPEEATAAGSDGSPPWQQSSMEEPPRLSARTEEEILAAARAIPWEDARKQEQYEEEEIQYMDYEQESSEMSERHPAPPKRSHKSRRREESYEHEEAMEVEPKLYDDQGVKLVHQDDIEEIENAAARDDWHMDQQMMHKKFRTIPRSRSLDEDMPRVLEQEGYEEAFMAVDPRRFGPHKAVSDEEEGEEEHEPSSIQSDREQQASSGSSCDRRRRGVIEEIDSDEFFLRQSGISQDDMNLDNYLPDEIRDALRSEIISALQDDELPPIPPQRPVRMRTLRKHKEVESNEAAPPIRPKRTRSTATRHSREASITDEQLFRERTRSDSRSDSRHRVVYQTEGDQAEPLQEPLDDIVVVKPVRRKSRSSLRSHSQPPMEVSILSPSTPVTVAPDSFTVLPTTPPIVPIRRKRSHRETMMDRRNGDVGAPICNGHHDEWEMEIVESKKPVVPTRSSRSRDRERFANGDVIMSASHENIDNLEMRFQSDAAPEPVPIPPKRRSRSRTTSVVADEDRTSHGAESLPEVGYVEEDIPREDENGSVRDLFGYAIVEKREKPPRPPPPRRKRDKFATTPRPIPPKRPQRAYSTLGPSRKRDISTAETIISTTLVPTESVPYIEIDAEEVEHRDFRSDELLNKIQGRPLPAPPRPPRARKEHAIGRPRTPFEYVETMEVTAATQTDPLPDDMVIEEITQAKLVVTPSRSGSQIMVSMERIPSPSETTTPPVPPLPMSQCLRKDEEEEEEEEEEERHLEEEDIRITFDTVSLTSPSPTREIELKDKHRSAPHLEERIAEESQPQPQSQPQVRSSLLADDTLRISSLEVGDLKVDRLSVSQIEAHKIMTSEVDAMMITASELRGGGSMEESLSPAIIRELMAIRSHLETVATQAQERYRESEKEAASHKTIDVSIEDDIQLRERQSVAQDNSSEETAKPSETVVTESAPTEDEKIEAGEDQKIPNTS